MPPPATATASKAVIRAAPIDAALITAHGVQIRLTSSGADRLSIVEVLAPAEALHRGPRLGLAETDLCRVDRRFVKTCGPRAESGFRA
jgi:hypothetical protein